MNYIFLQQFSPWHMYIISVFAVFDCTESDEINLVGWILQFAHFYIPFATIDKTIRSAMLLLLIEENCLEIFK